VYQLSGSYQDNFDAITNRHLDGHKLMKWWSLVEPEEGKYDWSVIEEPMNKWLAAGKRVMLSPITATKWPPKDMPAQPTPDWVFEAGAKSVPLYYDGKNHIRVPVYWDPIYLEKYRNFIKALGKQFDDRKGLELVYCGIGIYGETIISTELWGQETEKWRPWIEAGLTAEKWVEAVNAVVDAYADAFPRTLVGLQVSNPGARLRTECTPAYCRHAAQKSVLLQYDGITAEPFLWGGQYYASTIARWSQTTSIGFEAYGPSSGAVPPGARFKFEGSLKDLSDAAIKHKVNYLLVWYQDAVKATPGSKNYAPEWQAAMERAAASLKPDPAGVPAK